MCLQDPCCDEDSSWVYYRDQLTRYGAAEVYYIPVTTTTKGNNSDADVVAKVKTMSGFFFGGGDQTRIIYSFYNDDERVPSPVLAAIKETLSAVGGVVAGTSAGTDCQTAKVMIEGGDSYEALRDGTTIFWRSVHPMDENILAAYGPGGLGLFPYGLLDTHFSNRGRHGRLVQLILDSLSLPAGYTRAFGVDENTALIVTGPWGNRIGSVIGERGVLVFDAAYATVTHEGIFGVWNARLSEGDTIDLNNLNVGFALFKRLMAPREEDTPPESSKDIFRVGTFEIDRMSQSLFESTSRRTEGSTLQTNPRFEVHLNKDWDDDFIDAAVAADGVDPKTSVYAFSYSGLKLNFRRSN